MVNMRNAFAGLFAGLLILLVPVTAGAAAPKSSGKSVCETGHRGMPAYDRTCLKTGTFRVGAMMWLDLPAGSKGHESRDAFNRRSLCKYSGSFGGIRATVREVFNDVAYDNYRNYAHVLTSAGSVAALDCTALGYKIK